MKAHNGFDITDESQWTITNVVRAQAAKFGDKTALIFIDGPEWTFRDCEQNALNAAGQLQASGINAGDTVALMVNSPLNFCRYWLGLSFLGATMVAINNSMRGTTLKHQLDISKCSFAVTDGQNAVHCIASNSAATIKTVNELQQGCCKKLNVADIHNSSPEDLSAIMFTSGTSGPSKGVLMPQAHCMLFAAGTIDNYQLTAEDTFYICLPLFHANGLYMQLLACLGIGCTAVVREKFSASNWLKDIRQYKATHTNTLGAVATFIVAQKETSHDKQHNLKVIGAAPLPTVASEAFSKRFNVPSVVPLYGMTEVNIPLYGSLNKYAPGTCGLVYNKYFEVEIRHPKTDEPVADGNTGEIMVRPKLAHGFMSGYVGMPEETLKAWRNLWFHTGDAGYRNSKGQFIFVDRIKDCIRKRGENISSYEVEQAFLAIDCIAEVAAYAVPAEGGEGMEDEVMIAVLLKEDANADIRSEIEVWINNAGANIPAFAVPRYIRITAELPKTRTGKIRKVVLREEGVTADTIDRSLNEN